MPLNISSDAIIEKNKITQDGVWLILLEFVYEDEPSVRVCLNGEEITWDSEVWYPAIFSISDIVETKDGEIPSIPLTFIDLNRTLLPIIEEYDGAIGATVTIRIVHSKYLSNLVPEFEEVTTIIETTVDDQAQITFKLGAENLILRRCPQQRYLKNSCRFIFKKAALVFTSGGTTEITASYWIMGDSSTDKAKILDVKLTSGSFAGGDAAGSLIIQTISGSFEAETISIYNDDDFEVLSRVQADVASVTGASSGRCGYTGTETSCNRSYTRCKELDNNERFGAFIGVGLTGFLK